MKTERRLLIADEAIVILAEEGLHGLTHRAVDRRLKLPGGSTSYYFRTRQALIGAAVDRLLEIDDADLDQLVGVLEEMIATARAGDPPVAADGELLASLFELWAAPERQQRLAARFELLLSAVRVDGDRRILAARQHFVDRTKELLLRIGVAAPEDDARAIVAMFDGLSFDALIDADGAEARHRVAVRLQRALDRR
ncbi:MAG: TetR/AcrR family transcriptional regulator [Solirubrobacterales bacterium]